MLFQISKGTKYFGVNDVFSDVQFEIKNNEKIALVGRNGCGKTTFLKCITGELQLDSGEIHKPNGVSIGYLSQTTFDDDQNTVQQEMDTVFSKVYAIKNQMHELEEKMKSDASEKTLNQYAELQTQFEEMNGYNIQSELLTVFTKFGFTSEDLNRQINTFSGGQRTRIAFVKLLLSKPDILLLDEPTNHLDLETIEWLEGYLKHYDKAVILVSHDRMFLDDIVEIVYEIEYGKMKKYVGNYTSFVEQKRNDQERQAQAYSRQQKDIERLETLIEKFRYKKNKAAFAQSKIKYLDRMERVEDVRKNDTRTFKANFSPKIKGGNTVLVTDNLKIGYDEPLCTINLELLRGNRIGILGPNGTGKSTFLKTIVGKVPALAGSYLLGHQIEIGYFDQQLAQFSSNKTVLEEVWDEYPELDRTAIRSVLGRFLFSADDVFKTVDVLSGGEKVRLSLAKLLLQHGNFLLLDEPTNHLDIIGKEALEDSLKNYEGSILFVSHDRYFIKQIATSLLVIENGQAKYYPYGYQQYVDERNGVVSQPVKKEKSEPVKEEVVVPTKPKMSPGNRAREIKKLEAKISQQEELLEQKRDLRFEPEYYHDYQKMNDLNDEIDGIHNEINHLMKQWEELNEE